MRPPAGRATAFVNIVTFRLRPGFQQQFLEGITSATEILMEANWGEYYVWTSPVLGGGPGPSMSLVSFHTSWADMAEPNPTFEALMAQALGEGDFMEWTSELGETYRGVESITIRLRPDLGVNQN